MKNVVRFLSFCSLVFVLVLLTGCSSNDKYLGKYNVVSINGDTTLVELYDYNYIELKDKGVYVQKNAIQGEVFEQSGKWEIKGDKITLITESGSTKITETGTIKDGKITITGNVGEYELTIVWQKE